jgi:DNA polymerase
MNFTTWRDRARAFLAAGVRPYEATWDNPMPAGRWAELTTSSSRVPRRFLELASIVACHSDPERWSLLYSVLYRMTHGIPHLLEIPCDGEVIRLYALEQEVGRDAHRMQSFVRFRKVRRGGMDEYVAWHRPDHDVLERAAPWFLERFKRIRWAILTPDRCVLWDLRELRFGPGCASSAAPEDDELEELWSRYYAAAFGERSERPGASTR